MSMVFLGITHCKKCWAKLDGAIGLCESCRKVEEQEKKLDNKYKLIDILNKIANGELKQGIKVKWYDAEYNYTNGELVRMDDEGKIYFICEDICLAQLNYEGLELIEPDDVADVGKMVEPTDNTKIEELDAVQCEPMLYNSHAIMGMIIENRNKLNEVIRKINKENNNE